MDLVGRDIGNYRILRLLGEGGMGAVYEAVHPEIGRRVAIKTLLPELARNSEAIARFFREARAVNQVRHRSLVQVFDLGRTDEGTVYSVMELLEGESLGARLRARGALPVGEALALFAACADALRAVHAQGIVHRDLKPDNVFLARDAEDGSQVPKILDFGIARVVTGDESLTATGAIIGTPRYMAPEQCQGAKDLDARADVYAMGGMLFHMLAGRPPFEGEGAAPLLLAHLSAPVPLIRGLRPDVSPEIDAAVQRAMAKRPADRFPGMAEFMAAVGRGAHRG